MSKNPNVSGRTTYELMDDMAPGLYADLMRGVASLSTYVGFVQIFDLEGYQDQAKAFLSEMAPFLVRSEHTKSWPGTQMVTMLDPVRHLFRAEPEAIEVILAHSDGFGVWENPAMLDDIHFLRADESVMLGHTSSEHGVWVDVDPQELARLSDSLPFYASPATAPALIRPRVITPMRGVEAMTA
ncbi:MAG: hypothetical protein FWF36_08655 [Propionibacteriaceae bacterium]|nr:hypothetical protein [Propionibacteriaceae bacterium]